MGSIPLITQLSFLEYEPKSAATQWRTDWNGPRRLRDLRVWGFILIFSFTLGCASDNATEPATGAGGSESGGIGELCVPYYETESDFAGHYASENTIQEGSASCTSDICMTWQFAGRVTCPEGQDQATLALPDDHPARCRTPSGEAVTVVVPPQDPNTPAEGHVYCTCECGENAEAPCVCPANMICSRTIGADLAWVPSYCAFQELAPSS